MVRLGGDDRAMDPDAEQGSSYMELRPSTTLLVPFEFMEGQDGLMDAAHLASTEPLPNVVAEEQQSEMNTGFTLMLDTDEDGVREAAVIGNALQTSELPELLQVESEDVSDKPDVVPLDADDMQEAPKEEEREEMEAQTDLQTEVTAAELETEDPAEQNDLEVEEIRPPEDDKAISVSVLEERPAAANDAAKTEYVEEVVTEENKPISAEEAQLPEENGPVDTEMEKTKDNKHDLKMSSDTEAGPEEETEEKPRRRTRHKKVEEESVERVDQSEGQTEKQTPASQRKKAPSTPTRRMTRGRNVTFVSPLPEEADEPGFTETSSTAPASPPRTPRKGKALQSVTPRRSARKTQPESPKEEAQDVDGEIPFASTSKMPSQGRRSQRAAATRAGSKEEEPATTEVEVKEEIQQDEVVEAARARRTSSKTQTPSKRSTTQTGTPRRSSRKTTNSCEVQPAPLVEPKEEEKEEPVVPPVKHSARKMRPEVLPALFEEDDEKKQQLSSPGRTTRQSSRLSLNVYPQVCYPKPHFTNRFTCVVCIHLILRVIFNIYRSNWFVFSFLRATGRREKVLQKK